MSRDTLEAYRGKRNFDRTAEPYGEAASGRGGPVFVVQKHAASRLHYDFRLEAGGVLKSWAVPKGPSLSPRDKRLAVRTEDHPLDYKDFEGVIPEGEYGAGRVIVWDAGTFENLTELDGRLISLEDAVERGHAKVRLRGEKLVGAFALTRTRGNDWILVKMKDEEADPDRNPVADSPRSVLTGRTLEELS